MVTEASEIKVLLRHLVVLPEDYDPWGQNQRWADDAQNYPDCSCGCIHARWLDGNPGSHWCVCVNPQSHRAGLLTFDQQGCQRFEGTL